MNFIGFSDSKIHTHKNPEKKNGHKLKMSLSMVNKEKIFIYLTYLLKNILLHQIKQWHDKTL